jgi:hypothetical protein
MTPHSYAIHTNRACSIATLRGVLDLAGALTVKVLYLTKVHVALHASSSPTAEQWVR